MRLLAAAAAAALVGASATGDAPDAPPRHVLPSSAVAAAPPAVGAPVAYTQLQLGVLTPGALIFPSSTSPFDVYNYYNFSWTGGQAAIKFYLWPQVPGDADLFVSDATNPTPGWFGANWTCASDFTEVVEVVTPATCSPAAPCWYYASASPFYNLNATYTIGVLMSTDPAPLVPGEQMYGFVYANDYNKYNITWTPSSMADRFTVSMTTLSGDPDLYLTVFNGGGPAAYYPTVTNFTYAAYGVTGNELLIVKPSPILGAPGVCNVGVPCTLAISVFGFVGGSYNLVAGGPNVAVQLASGVPLQGYVAQGSTSFYAFPMPNATNVSIVVTSLSGDPELFVSAVNPFPGYLNFTWASTTTNADERIWIPTSDPFYPGWTPFTFYIGVLGYNGNATYTITATAVNGPATPITLIDGVPYAGRSPAHGMAYYSFTLSNQVGGQQGLDIVTTPRSGDVDIYVSNITTVVNGQTVVVPPRAYCALTWTPTGACLSWAVDNTTYTWSSSLAYSADVVSIPQSAVYAGEKFIVGVFATSPDDGNGNPPPASHYDIVATTTGTVTTLQAGVAIPGIASPGLYKSYRFDIANAADVIVLATLDMGGIDMFAAENYVPNATVNTWNNTAKGGILRDRFLYIPFANLSTICQARVNSGITCPLYISVQGWASMQPPQQAVYHLAAEYSGSTAAPLPLNNGFPTWAYVPQYGYAFLSTQVYVPGGNQTLYVSVTNYGGSTSLWVNIGYNKTFAVAATSTTADYASTDLGGWERVIIAPTMLHAQGANPAGNAKAGGLFDGASKATTDTYALRRRLVTADELAAIPSVRTVDVWDGGKRVRSLHPDTDGPFLLKYHRQVMADYTAAVDASLGRSDGSGPLGDAAYCNNCPLYVTVYGRTSSYVSVQYTSGAVVEALKDDVQVFRSAPALPGASYYSFPVLSSQAGILLQIQQITGAVTAYVMVESSSTPNVMPGPQRYNYIMEVWAGQSGLRISPNDTSFCVSQDGFTNGPPCNYLIAVQSRSATATAYYTIIATNDASQPIIDLAEDVPETGRVGEGEYYYYTFTASTPGTPPPSVSIYNQPLSGRVELYVTNQYVPGVSSASLLPSKGNTRLTCMWTASNWTSWVGIAPTDPCYDPTKNVYTIGVLGASYISGLVSRYMLTASSGRQVRLLPLGTQFSNRLVPDNVNVTYVFDVEDATQDVVISATPAYGSVAIAVRKHYRSDVDPTDPNAQLWLPGCYQAYTGAQIVCSGYTWFATSANAAPAVYIDASNPCTPVSALGVPPVTVNASCNATTDWTVGRYFVTVYGVNAGLNEYSISVVGARRPPNDVLTVAEGQPQLGFTSNVTVCPYRRNDTGACTGYGATAVQGAFFTFRVPAEFNPAAQLDQYVFIERLCGGRTTGDCGYPLAVYVRACMNGYCNAVDQYPHPATVYDFSLTMRRGDTSAGLSVPYGACYGPSGTLRTADCVYFVGVYPQCHFRNSTPVGANCTAPEMFRFTYTGNTGTTRVPVDCFSGPYNETCKLPAETAQVGDILRYEALLPQDTTTLSKVTVTSCVGSASVYVCTPFAPGGSKCNPWSYPGPPNYDTMLTTGATGTAVYAGYSTSLAFWGVQPTVPSGVNPAVMTNGSFYVSVSQGAGAPQLVPQGDAPPVASRDATGTTVSVQWIPPLLFNSPENPIPYTPPNVGYSAYLFATSPGTALPVPPLGLLAYNLRDPCGVAAAHAACPGGCAKVIATASTSAAVTFTGLDPQQYYTVAVTATCNAFWCMPAGLQSQSFAYNPVPASSPLPPVPSASPSPGAPSGPGGGGGGGSSAGPIVGGIIAGLAAVGVAFGGFVWFRRRSGGGGGRGAGSSAYAPPSPLGDGGGVVNNLLNAVSSAVSSATGVGGGGAGNVAAYSSSVLGPEGQVQAVDMGAAYTEFHE